MATLNPFRDPVSITLEQLTDFLYGQLDKEYEHVKFSPPKKVKSSPSKKLHCGVPDCGEG